MDVGRVRINSNNLRSRAFVNLLGTVIMYFDGSQITKKKTISKASKSVHVDFGHANESKNFINDLIVEKWRNEWFDGKFVTFGSCFQDNRLLFHIFICDYLDFVCVM